MAVMTGARSGEDPKRIGHTLTGPSPIEHGDVCQGRRIRGRSRNLVRNAGTGS